MGMAVGRRLHGVFGNGQKQQKIQPLRDRSRLMKYRWWKKSCTSSVNPTICSVLQVPGGAEFLPSTVLIGFQLPCGKKHWTQHYSLAIDFKTFPNGFQGCGLANSEGFAESMMEHCLTHEILTNHRSWSEVPHRNLLRHPKTAHLVKKVKPNGISVKPVDSLSFRRVFCSIFVTCSMIQNVVGVSGILHLCTVASWPVGCRLLPPSFFGCSAAIGHQVQVLNMMNGLPCIRRLR